MTYPYPGLWIPLYAEDATTAPDPPWQDQWDAQLVPVECLHSDDSPFSDGAPYVSYVLIEV